MLAKNEETQEDKLCE